MAWELIMSSHYLRHKEIKLIHSCGAEQCGQDLLDYSAKGISHSKGDLRRSTKEC